MTRGAVNVLVSYSYSSAVPISEEHRRQIEAVSPRIVLWDVSELVNAERQGDTSARERLDALLAQAEIYCGFPGIENIIARAPKMKWIQSAIAGVDPFLTPDVIASPVILTKARIHDQQISEAVFNMILMLARRSLEQLRGQLQKRRERLMPTVLHSKTLGIVGLGNIGQAVARLGKAFGMRVVATRLHPEIANRYVDVMLPSGGLRELLTQSDFVVILLPITKDTENFIGEAELRAMKPTAYIINVARGGIIDQQALIRALSENWIAGAGLDVLATDPDPPPDEIWELTNVVLTPHSSGQRADYSELLNQQFCKNLKRYLRGKELLNIVDKRGGY